MSTVKVRKVAYKDPVTGKIKLKTTIHAKETNITEPSYDTEGPLNLGDVQNTKAAMAAYEQKIRDTHENNPDKISKKEMDALLSPEALRDVREVVDRHYKAEEEYSKRVGKELHKLMDKDSDEQHPSIKGRSMEEVLKDEKKMTELYNEGHRRAQDKDDKDTFFDSEVRESTVVGQGNDGKLRTGSGLEYEDGVSKAQAQQAFNDSATRRMKTTHKESVKQGVEEALEGKHRESEFNLTDKHGSWVNKNLFKEQIWLLKDWMPKELMRDQKTYRAGPGKGMGDDPNVLYCYAETLADSRAYISSLLALSYTDVYPGLPPSLQALLVPKIELMLEYRGKKTGKVTTKPLRFDEYLSKKDLMELISGKQKRIPGIGLMSVQLEDKSQSAAELRKNYVLTLKVRSQSLAEFSSKADDSGRATFRDLWYNVSQKKRNPGSQNNILRIALGWQVPHYTAIQSAHGRNCTEKLAKKIAAAFKRNNMTYRLYLSKYNLNFNQDGSVEYEGTYIAAMPSDVFGRDAFPMDLNHVIKYVVPNPETGAMDDVEIQAKEIQTQMKNYEKKLEQLRKEQRDSMAKQSKTGTSTSNAANAEKNQKMRDRIHVVTSSMNNLKEKAKDARFQGVIRSLLGNESVHAVTIKVENQKIMEGSSNMDDSTASGTVESAALGAMRNQAGSQHTGLGQTTAVALHNAVSAAQGLHIIPFVRFGAILESFIDGIKKNSKTQGTAPKKVYSNNFQIQLGPATIRYNTWEVYVCNIGELPITMGRLTEFMQAVYSRIPWDSAPFPFSELFEMMSQNLLGEILNSHDFIPRPTLVKGKKQDVNSRHSPKVKTFSASHAFMSKYKKKIVLGGSSKQAQLLPKTNKNFGGYSNAIRNLGKAGEVTDIYFFYIEEYAPCLLGGTLAENSKNGIYHFFIGSDVGILKNLSFSEDNIQGRQEAIMLSDTDDREKQILKFDANLKLVGNSLFSNSDLIYIDPKFAGRDLKDSMIQNGLGGYYYVTKVNHTFSRDGFETELAAKWNAFGGRLGDRTKRYDYFYTKVGATSAKTVGPTRAGLVAPGQSSEAELLDKAANEQLKNAAAGEIGAEDIGGGGAVARAFQSAALLTSPAEAEAQRHKTASGATREKLFTDPQFDEALRQEKVAARIAYRRAVEIQREMISEASDIKGTMNAAADLQDMNQEAYVEARAREFQSKYLDKHIKDKSEYNAAANSLKLPRKEDRHARTKQQQEIAGYGTVAKRKGKGLKQSKEMIQAQADSIKAAENAMAQMGTQD